MSEVKCFVLSDRSFCFCPQNKTRFDSLFLHLFADESWCKAPSTPQHASCFPLLPVFMLSYATHKSVTSLLILLTANEDISRKCVKSTGLCAAILPAAGECWCRCARTQWTLSSLWPAAARDGAAQLSPSTSRCRASLQRKWPEPWQTRGRAAGSESVRKWGWFAAVCYKWLWMFTVSTQMHTPLKLRIKFKYNKVTTMESTELYFELCIFCESLVVWFLWASSFDPNVAQISAKMSRQSAKENCFHPLLLCEYQLINWWRSNGWLIWFSRY